MTPGTARPLTRRQVLRAAAAIAALGSAGCVSVSRSSTTLATSPSAPSSTALAPLTVSVVGDSISFLSRIALEVALEAAGLVVAEFDAVPGRRIIEGDKPGVAVLDVMIALGVAPDLWVIELGTNDLGGYPHVAAYFALIGEVVERIPPPTPLVWVDTYSSFLLADAEIFNATLREAMTLRGNAAVANWFAKCVEVGPQVLVPDGLHPVDGGFEIFAEVTVEPIASLVPGLA